MVLVILIMFVVGGVTIGEIHHKIEEPRTVTVKETRTEIHKERSWLTTQEYYKRLNKTDL